MKEQLSYAKLLEHDIKLAMEKVSDRQAKISEITQVLKGLEIELACALTHRDTLVNVEKMYLDSLGSNTDEQEK